VLTALNGDRSGSDEDIRDATAAQWFYQDCSEFSAEEICIGLSMGCLPQPIALFLLLHSGQLKQLSCFF
jgi:hypothetical protein